MVITKRHRFIDWAVVALFGSGAASRPLPPPVRVALGTAALYRASYTSLTDYGAGLHPRLTMRQHLVLDALGGLAMFGAGLMMRRQAPAVRALLMGAGLSELALAAYSEARGTEPTRGTVSYAPLDTLKSVAADVSIVDSALPGLMGSVLSARMTVIRLSNGDLLLHSPTRFTMPLKNELQAIGHIAHLVAPNVAHWTFLKDWQQACPDATTWAAPGLRERGQVQRSGVRLDYDLGETAPALWGYSLKLVMVRGGFGFHEAALFHQPSRTLVLTDLVVNLELAKLPEMIRPIVRLFGMAAPDGMPPPYLRAVIKLRRRAAVRAASRLLDLDPQRVVFAHGRWFETGGAHALKRSLRWLVD